MAYSLVYQQVRSSRRHLLDHFLYINNLVVAEAVHGKKICAQHWKADSSESWYSNLVVSKIQPQDYRDFLVRA